MDLKLVVRCKLFYQQHEERNVTQVHGNVEKGHNMMLFFVGHEMSNVRISVASFFFRQSKELKIKSLFT